MKVEAVTLDIDRGNVNGQTIDFKMAANSVAFETLSSTLYTDPVAAIIRELSCNAFDAHVAAGNEDRPFFVQIPTSMDPQLIIRDYGIGLCEADVFDLYTTYFDSTKRDSDLFTGALGLGSKSPFAYTNMYEVTSYFNGKRMVFSVYKNEQNMPAITKLGEFDTDEPNGLQVIVNVEQQDIAKFSRAAKRTFPFFSVTPRFSMDDDINESRTAMYVDQNMLPSTVVTDLFRMERVTDQSRAGLIISMANVGYRVDSSRMDLDGRYKELLESVRMVINLPNGSIKYAASREEIRYTPETAATLTTTLDQVVQGIFDKLSDEYVTANIQDDWSKRLFVLDWSHRNFNNYKMLRKLLASFDVTLSDELDELVSVSESVTTLPKNLPLFHYFIQRYKKRSRRNGIDVYSTDELDCTSTVYLNDRVRGGDTALRKLARDTGKTVYAITQRKVPLDSLQIHDRELDDVVILERSAQHTAESELKLLVDALGGVPLVDATILVDEHKRPRPEPVKADKGEIKVRRIASHDALELMTEKVDTEGQVAYYVEITPQKKIVLDKKWMSESTMNRYDAVSSNISSFRNYDIKYFIRKTLDVLNKVYGTEDIIGNVRFVTKTEVKKIADDPNWVNMFDAFHQHITKNVKVLNVMHTAQFTSYLFMDIGNWMAHYSPTSTSHNSVRVTSLLNELPNTSPMRKFIVERLALKERANKIKDKLLLDTMDAIKYFDSNYRLSFNAFEVATNLEWANKVNDEMFKKYPLLEHVSFGYGNKDMTSVIQYVKLMDSLYGELPSKNKTVEQ